MKNSNIQRTVRTPTTDAEEPSQPPELAPSNSEKAPREHGEIARLEKRRRRRACRTLGIAQTEGLLYGAQAAADALGVSVGTIRKHIKPADFADNPHYRYAGAPVGLYDPLDLAKALRKKAIRQARDLYASRKAAAEKAILTRMKKMEARMEEVEIRIVRGKTDEEIYELALRTHGGNYRGDPGPFSWNNRTARNCIRHCLTNYESLWALCNRGYTGEDAYQILRDRVDALIDEAYPQFTEEEGASEPALQGAAEQRP